MLSVSGSEKNRKRDLCMGFLRKIAAAAVAGVLCFVGTGALPESALMLQEHVFAASGETASETKYYTGGYKSDFCGWKMDWSFTISYVILTKSYEDAPGDDAALDKHIKITGVSVSTSCILVTTCLLYTSDAADEL